MYHPILFQFVMHTGKSPGVSFALQIFIHDSGHSVIVVLFSTAINIKYQRPITCAYKIMFLDLAQ